MTRVKIHRNQVTLTDELRRALSSVDDDELDAVVVEEGVLLRPSQEARRKAAWRRARGATGSVRYIGPEPRPSPEEEEEMIADLLAADKADEAAKKKYE